MFLENKPLSINNKLLQYVLICKMNLNCMYILSFNAFAIKLQFFDNNRFCFLFSAFICVRPTESLF